MRTGSVALYHTSTHILARTSSTLQCLQTLDPFTDMYTYTGLCLAHPLDIMNTFWYHCQLGFRLADYACNI